MQKILITGASGFLGSEFISRFPKSPYRIHANQRLIYLKNLLAQHEIHVAEFYMKRKAYVAAIGRAKYIIQHMPKTPQTPVALSILVRAYGIIGYEELQKENLKILKLNYPNFVSENLNQKNSHLVHINKYYFVLIKNH